MPMLLVMTALFIAAPAVADGPAGARPKPPKGSPEEVVCHREAPTGSLIASKRTCMTRAHWQVEADIARSQTQAMDDAGRINSCGSPNPGGCGPTIGH